MAQERSLPTDMIDLHSSILVEHDFFRKQISIIAGFKSGNGIFGVMLYKSY
jgi:hypothetical protein